MLAFYPSVRGRVSRALADREPVLAAAPAALPAAAPAVGRARSRGRQLDLVSEPSAGPGSGRPLRQRIDKAFSCADADHGPDGVSLAGAGVLFPQPRLGPELADAAVPAGRRGHDLAGLRPGVHRAASLAPRKLRYCREHWIDLAIIGLPLVGFLRILRIGQVWRLHQLSRVGRAYRVRGLGSRMFRGVLLLNVIRRMVEGTPVRRLAARCASSSRRRRRNSSSCARKSASSRPSCPRPSRPRSPDPSAAGFRWACATGRGYPRLGGWYINRRVVRTPLVRWSHPTCRSHPTS